MTQELWDDVGRWTNRGHPIFNPAPMARPPTCYAFHPDQHGPRFYQCPYDDAEGIINRTWEELNGSAA